MDDYSEQEIEIKAPITSIVDTIENDFLDENELINPELGRNIQLGKNEVAKFITYSLIQYKADNDSSVDELSMFLDNLEEENDGKYNAKQVLNTDFVIVFSEIKKGILLDVLNFLIDSFSGLISPDGKINYALISKATIRILCRCIKKLDTPLQKCIFKCLLEIKRECYIAEEIYILCYCRHTSVGGCSSHPCDRLDLACGKIDRRDNVSCTATLDDIKVGLKELGDKGILKPKGDGWELIP